MAADARPTLALKRVPGPAGLPVVGVLPSLLRSPFDFLMRQAARHQGIVRVPVGPIGVYLVYHPDYVQHILVQAAGRYEKGRIMQGIRLALGNGLFTSEGDFWRRQRRLMQPAFHHRMVERMTAAMAGAIQQHVDGWQPLAARGQPVDMLKEMVTLNIKITLDTLFGSTVKPADAEWLFHATDAVFLGMSKNLWTFFLPSSLPLPGRRQYLRSIRALDRRIMQMVAERRASGEERNDLLGILLSMRDEESGAGMSDRQLRDEIFTFFLAGYESTSSALTWAWYLLAKHPDVEAKLQGELASVLHGRPPTLVDLPNLPYAQMVLDETLRLYSPFPIYFRTAIEDDQIDGMKIPAGAPILISPYAAHHHAAYWDKPEVFDPERFSAARLTDQVKHAYFPFGKGQRLCIGRPLALAEAHLTLCAIAQRFDRRLLPGVDPKPRFALTLQPKGGLPLLLTERKPAAQTASA